MAEPIEPRRGRRLRRVLRFVARRPRTVLIAAAVLIAALVLAPLLGVVGGLLDVLGIVIGPLVTTAAGRLALLNVALLGLALWGFAAARARYAAMRTALRLRRHLDGVRLLLAGDGAAADALFARVIADPARPPAAWPCLAEDARLKRARIALDAAQPEAAMRHLIELDVDALPAALRRAAQRLRIAAERTLGEVLPAALERSLRDALAAAPTDAVLLGELAALLRQDGRHADAAAVQERLVDALAPARRAAARAMLVDDLLAAAEAELDAPLAAPLAAPLGTAGPPGAPRDRGFGGLPDAPPARPQAQPQPSPHAPPHPPADARQRDAAHRQPLDRARLAALEAQLDRAASLADGDPRPDLLRGRAREQAGEPAAAARAFAASRSTRGLDEIVRLLDIWPGLLSPREILEVCPLQGAVLLAAREHARRGELDAARRAAALAARHLPPTPRTATMLAEILERCGDADAVRELRRAAARDLARLDPATPALRPPPTAW